MSIFGQTENLRTTRIHHFLKEIILLKNLTLQKRDHFSTAVFVSIRDMLILGVFNYQHFAVPMKRQLPMSILGVAGIDNRHGEDRQSAFHCSCESSITSNRSLGGLGTMQPHHLRAKHGVATSSRTKHYQQFKSSSSLKRLLIIWLK